MSELSDFVRDSRSPDSGDGNKTLADLNRRQTEAERLRKLAAMEEKKRLYGVGDNK